MKQMEFELDTKQALSKAGRCSSSATEMVFLAMINIDPSQKDFALTDMEEIAKKLEDGARCLRGEIAVIRHDLSKIEDVEPKKYVSGPRPTKEFQLGSAVATVGIRENGSMWIGVQSNVGAHFQCDFEGDFIDGPKSFKDFRTDPPSWVHKLFLGVK
jgi:hypothetical protein